ncbi:MAG: hypothetical protein STSR0009_00630 [Methanoregula sp.]
MREKELVENEMRAPVGAVPYPGCALYLHSAGTFIMSASKHTNSEKKLMYLAYTTASWSDLAYGRSILAVIAPR